MFYNKLNRSVILIIIIGCLCLSILRINKMPPNWESDITLLREYVVNQQFTMAHKMLESMRMYNSAHELTYSYREMKRTHRHWRISFNIDTINQRKNNTIPKIINNAQLLASKARFWESALLYYQVYNSTMDKEYYYITKMLIKRELSQ